MAAAERLAAAVEELGGDQRRFESVVSATSPKGVRRVELAQRRAAFRANAHLWGRSVDCTAGVLALLPGSDPGMIDGVYVFGNVGVRATRAGVRLPLGVRPGVAEATRWTDAEGVSGRRAEPEFALFPEFSTVAPGALERTTQEDGVAVTEVTLSGVRQVDAQTVFVRQKMHNVDTAERMHSALAAAFVTWPTEVLHLDLALPAGMATAGTLRQWVYANREEPSASRKMRRRDQAELHEDVTVYREVAGPPASAEVAFMPAMFSATLQWLKRGPMRWDVFRLRVEYPVLHSLYAVTTGCAGGPAARK